MTLATALAALLAAASPAPERGVAVVLEPVAGKVYVREDGVETYRRLRAAERLPVGATVDAQEGRVRLVVAHDDDGGVWRAVFSQGKFGVTQPAEGEPVATLKLTGPTFRETCADATAARRKKKPVRRLWGNGRGRFRTAGHYSAATVRGTRWLTEDRCDGTLTRVLRGTVEVEDFTDVPAPDTPAETGPVPGGGDEGPAAPQPAPVSGAPGSYVVPAGGSYVARPGR